MYKPVYLMEDEVEVRSLCRPVKSFHTKLGKAFLYGAGFVQGDIVMLKQEKDKHELLTYSWKHTIA